MNTVTQMQATTQSLIQCLADGQYHANQELATQLGISVADIHAHIEEMAHWGLAIESIAQGGYQLSHPLDLLDVSDIQQQVSNPIHLFSVIDSTNKYLLENFATLAKGSVCLAEYQSHGRGRRGRVWHSPYGANLYFSMSWRLTSGIDSAMGLSLAIGVAIVDALEMLGAQGISLKWPNDVYLNGKKLAGVLVEISSQHKDSVDLVIGMGLNINMQASVGDVDQPWANLVDAFHGKDDCYGKDTCYDKQVSKNDLVIALINAWNRVLTQYEQQGLQPFVQRWIQLDHFKNKPIQLIMADHTVKGLAKGIDSQGAICIETASGIETYIGGEISLRSD